MTKRRRIGAANERAGILDGLGDFSEAIMEGHAPNRVKIQATTKAEQFRKFKDAIPTGCDTRRATTQNRDLMEASRSFGYGRVTADGENHKLKGLKTSLMSHQLTVVSWMVGRENAPMPPFGGIQGDVMGMGKTLDCLAVVVGHPPEKEDIEKYSAATLVVVPNDSVCKHWREEVSRHCMWDTYLQTRIFNRISGTELPIEELRRLLIV
jgi:SNF2 family DNA or RNA helicase